MLLRFIQRMILKLITEIVQVQFSNFTTSSGILETSLNKKTYDIKKNCLVVYYETVHVECSSLSVFARELKKTVRRSNR